jgi:hypothetical protein
LHSGLSYKRLSKWRFRWWPQSLDAAQLLRAHQLQVLLAAGNPEIDAAPVWRKLGYRIFPLRSETFWFILGP